MSTATVINTDLCVSVLNARGLELATKHPKGLLKFQNGDARIYLALTKHGVSRIDVSVARVQHPLGSVLPKKNGKVTCAVRADLFETKDQVIDFLAHAANAVLNYEAPEREDRKSGGRASMPTVIG